jgi:hypothetical protein
MATLEEFKKWLDQFPPDTIIEVAVQETSRRYESYGPVSFKEFKIQNDKWGDGFEFVDFRNSEFVKPGNPEFGKCFLRLGEEN